MTRGIITRAALLGGAALLCTAPVHAERLRDAIAAAYTTNPTLAEAQARQEALEEAPEQARAEGRPTLSATANGGYDDLGYGSAGSTDLQAAMPIWTGGRVSAAVRASSADVAAGEQVLRDSEAAVLQSVVAAYADLLFAQQAVEVARIGIERLDRQVGEAQSRFDLGQATKTDVAQLQAQRSSVVANLADAEAALASSRAAYRAVVGEDPGDLEAEVPPPARLPADIADARAAAELANPRLLERLRIVDASEARIDRARADGAPSVAPAGTYGRGVRETSGDLRGYDNAASVGVTLHIPLLTGGMVASRVREAEATTRADRYAVQAELRETMRSVETAWATLQAAGQREEASRDGLAAAQIALDGVRAEYEFGLRSTIDILLAEQSYRAAQLALARARSDVLVAQAALLRATGHLDRAAFLG
ncbi:TolC family outer membrane protein [Altericroceibacterium endophyticum]|uniref:TolC family outer membrane protein n=1 Tax=Altericroceibacterium endophyticum TaxID=1808508 RepID=A0A6I4T4A0_9SPHN|nr:TolC family outer membrane protein [Altericroceibacterium endophyticum]MXO64790.1 TolC family outer membrane protein [Altericroceibacterium endophyticum]